MPRSFLGSLATERHLAQSLHRQSRYDVKRDVTLVRVRDHWADAVGEDRPPKTLKADIERGEDQKLWG